jgi:hypothetical protein
VERKARAALTKLDVLKGPGGSSDESVRREWDGSTGSIRTLWEGLEEIAAGVRESCEDGTEF